jgi:hypothetical protein
MDTQEALLKINEIYQVMESNNKVIFSGEKLIAIGIYLLLIPFLEIFTNYLTFGLVGDKPVAVGLIHFLFYLFSIQLISKFEFKEKSNHSVAHPLIQKAFQIGKPFYYSIIGIIVALLVIGQAQLAHPVVFILQGLLFNLYGRFSIPAVSWIAWSFIVVGIGYALLTPYQISNLWIYMLIYNGLAYVAMGFLLRRARREVE